MYVYIYTCIHTYICVYVCMYVTTGCYIYLIYKPATGFVSDHMVLYLIYKPVVYFDVSPYQDICIVTEYHEIYSIARSDSEQFLFNFVSLIK